MRWRWIGTFRCIRWRNALKNIARLTLRIQVGIFCLTLDRPVYIIHRMSPIEPETSPTEPPPLAPTRDRLIAAMQDALRHKGYHGVGLKELLDVAQAPKGVLYHHFPGGKAELAVASIEAVVSQLTAGLQRLLSRNPDVVQALGMWMESAQKSLASSGYERGCPLATIALESAPDDTAIRQALADGFAAIRQQLGTTLQQAGIAEARAGNLAALIVSAYEGALVQARVAGNVAAMQATSQALMDLVRMSLPNDSSASPSNV
jgi:TetR/AcrR family transcriptional repressor of lmrAB and yxaGH operons